MIHILEPGLRSTVQDAPRLAHLRTGLPAAGPADPLAARAARALAGDGALIEIVGLPFTFRCDDRRVVAVTGRDVALRTAARVPGWTAALVRAGEVVTVTGRARYAYLAVSGGLDLAAVLGSRATYLPAAIGPLPRPLRAGDALPLGPAPAPADRPGARLDPPAYDGTVLAVPGPHRARFAQPDALFTGSFAVAAESDRMGVRLDGPPLTWEGADLLTCGVAHGAVQVPRGGAPIVLGPDAQTTGGYPVIAVVAGVSLGSVAQALPGERLRFVAVRAGRAADALRAAFGALAV